MISYREARELIEDEIGKLKRNIIEVSLEDSDGLTLAEDIYSDINMPGFNNSSMDGYAINYTDGNKSWKIKGEIPAGNFKEYPIDIDSAVRIMTGGKIPLDTNAVIPIEDVTEDGDVIILKENIKVNPDQYIRFKGNDLKTGVIALKKNSLLKAQNIALAAACGKTRLKVYSKLNAGIMVTGDELVEITEDPGEDKVRATNLYSLLAGAMEINVNPINLGIVKDDKDLLMRSITSALQSDIDILITSGGVSVGKYDLLKDIFKEAGVETIFWRVNVRPGKPLFFGKYNKDNKTKLIFGLPGNPVSSFVSFTIFIKPAVKKFYGHADFNPHTAKLEHMVKKEDSKRHFIRGMIKFDAKLKEFTVNVPGSQSSGNLAGLSDANCLIVIPEEMTNPGKGEDVECIMI